MNAETPRQLPLPKADLLPLGPEVKIIRVPGLQAVGQELEGGAAAPALLCVTIRTLRTTYFFFFGLNQFCS